jgi:hypothetical protein
MHRQTKTHPSNKTAEQRHRGINRLPRGREGGREGGYREGGMRAVNAVVKIEVGTETEERMHQLLAIMIFPTIDACDFWHIYCAQHFKKIPETFCTTPTSQFLSGIMLACTPGRREPIIFGCRNVTGGSDAIPVVG